jgi:hypothetical protein
MSNKKILGQWLFQRGREIGPCKIYFLARPKKTLRYRSDSGPTRPVCFEL